MANLDVFFKTIGQVKTAQENLLAIKNARKNLERENELFDIEKRKANIELEEAEMTGRMDRFGIKILEAQNKEKLSMGEDILKGKEATIDMEEQKQTGIAKSGFKKMKGILEQDPTALTQLQEIKDAGFEPVWQGGHFKGFEKKKSDVTQKDVAELAVKIAAQKGDNPRLHLQEARQLLGLEEYNDPNTMGGTKAGFNVGAVDSGVKPSAGGETKGNGTQYSEEDIQHTMKKHGLSRQEVLRRLKAKGR